jgi:probable HAF family extracellular repeat protein
MDGFYTTLLIEHPDYQLSFAADINAHGQLAGNLADQLLTGPSSPEMPFRFTDLDGDGALDQGELLLIGYLPGFVSARATGINDHGQVVGYTQANSGSFHGWLFTDLNDNNQVDNGELVDLGSLATNKSVFPNALNDLGHVTGYAADATYYSTMFRYADGAIAPIPGAGISTGLGINNHGAIVGDRTTAGQRKAAIFLPQAAYGLSAGLHDLPGEQAVGINDMGAVALLLNDTTGATPIQSAGIWHDGTLTTIPKRIGFSDAKPMDINATGDIVGLAQGVNSTNAHWLWNASGLVDLNQALPPATVFAIYWNKALALNDTGSVALTADFDFRSTPSGESGLLRAALLLVTQNGGTQPNEPPQILTGPSIAPNPVTGTTAHWNISATDPDGDDTALQFSWSTIVKPAHVNAPILSAVGQGLTGTITFSHAGAYRFQVIITDEDGAIANATVDVTVVASPSNLVISPPEVTVLPNSTTALSAQVVDQFGHTVQPQPSVSWSTTIGTLSAMTGAAVDLLAWKQHQTRCVDSEDARQRQRWTRGGFQLSMAFHRCMKTCCIVSSLSLWRAAAKACLLGIFDQPHMAPKMGKASGWAPCSIIFSHRVTETRRNHERLMLMVRVIPFFISYSPSFHRKTTSLQRMSQGHFVNRLKQTWTEILMELDCAIHERCPNVVLIHLRVSVSP